MDWEPEARAGPPGGGKYHSRVPCVPHFQMPPNPGTILILHTTHVTQHLPPAHLLSPMATHMTQPSPSCLWRALWRHPWAATGHGTRIRAAPLPTPHHPTPCTPCRHSITFAPVDPFLGGASASRSEGLGVPHPMAPQCPPFPSSVTQPLCAVQDPVLTCWHGAPLQVLIKGVARSGGTVAIDDLILSPGCTPHLGELGCGLWLPGAFWPCHHH